MTTFNVTSTGYKGLSYIAKKELAIRFIKAIGLTNAQISQRLNGKYPPSTIYVILTNNDETDSDKITEVLEAVIPYGTVVNSLETISINTPLRI